MCTHCLVVCFFARKLYFSDTGTPPAIYVCNLDGTNKRVLHNKDLDSPNALGIDFVENKLYWGDGDLRTVWYSELNGTNAKVCIYWSIIITNYEN